jgi:hypothetical protein
MQRDSLPGSSLHKTKALFLTSSVKGSVLPFSLKEGHLAITDSGLLVIITRPSGPVTTTLIILRTKSNGISSVYVSPMIRLLVLHCSVSGFLTPVW